MRSFRRALENYPGKFVSSILMLAASNDTIVRVGDRGKFAITCGPAAFGVNRRLQNTKSSPEQDRYRRAIWGVFWDAPRAGHAGFR